MNGQDQQSRQQQHEQDQQSRQQQHDQDQQSQPQQHEQGHHEQDRFETPGFGRNIGAQNNQSADWHHQVWNDFTNLTGYIQQSPIASLFGSSRRPRAPVPMPSPTFLNQNVAPNPPSSEPSENDQQTSQIYQGIADENHRLRQEILELKLQQANTTQNHQASSRPKESETIHFSKDAVSWPTFIAPDTADNAATKQQKLDKNLALLRAYCSSTHSNPIVSKILDSSVEIAKTMAKNAKAKGSLPQLGSGTHSLTLPFSIENEVGTKTWLSRLFANNINRVPSWLSTTIQEHSSGWNNIGSCLQSGFQFVISIAYGFHIHFGLNEPHDALELKKSLAAGPRLDFSPKKTYSRNQLEPWLEIVRAADKEVGLGKLDLYEIAQGLVNAWEAFTQENPYNSFFDNTAKNVRRLQTWQVDMQAIEECVNSFRQAWGTCGTKVCFATNIERKEIRMKNGEILTNKNVCKTHYRGTACAAKETCPYDHDQGLFGMAAPCTYGDRCRFTRTCWGVHPA